MLVQSQIDAHTLHACNMRWRGFARDESKGRWTINPHAPRRWVYLITLTPRHHRGHSLRGLSRAVLSSYRRCITGKAFVKMKRRYGMRASVRALELTHSANNGWHPHAHALTFVDRQLTPEEIESLREWYWLRWAAALVKLGYPRPTKEIGVTVIEADAGGRYLAKMGYVELADGGHKVARCGGCGEYRGTRWDGKRRCCVDCGREVNRTVSQLIDDLTDHPTERDKRLYRAYCHDIRGARRLTWSRRDNIDDGGKTLRELYAEHERVAERAKCPCHRLDPECPKCLGAGTYVRYRLRRVKRQDDLALQENRARLFLPAPAWRDIRRDPERLAAIKIAFETGDQHGLDALLGRWAPSAPVDPFTPDDPRPADEAPSRGHLRPFVLQVNDLEAMTIDEIQAWRESRS